MNTAKSLNELTADNNEVLRACRDSDAVDYGIDSSMMKDLLRKTPAERLANASAAARGLHAFLTEVRRLNK